MCREVHSYFGKAQDGWYIDIAAVVGGNYGHAALQVSEQSAQTIMSMDDVGAMLADSTSQRRQLAQVAKDAFAGDAVADYLHATGLKSGDLLFDEGREFALFI